MMMIEQFAASALKLPRHERAQLAEILISSLDEESDVDRAWEEEAERRYQRYLAGNEDVVSAGDVIAETRSELPR